MTTMPAGSGSSGRPPRPREGARVNSAVRGAGLIGLAVILGIVLLQVIDKGPSEGGTPASNRTPQTTTAGTTPTSQPATTAPAAARPRNEVRVVVYNAGAPSGTAANVTNQLRALGYQMAQPSNTTDRSGRAVACKQGYEKEATQLQGDAGQGATVEPFPAQPPTGSENVNCIVLVGSG